MRYPYLSEISIPECANWVSGNGTENGTYHILSGVGFGVQASVENEGTGHGVHGREHLGPRRMV